MVQEALVKTQEKEKPDYKEIDPRDIYVFGVFNQKGAPWVRLGAKIDESKKFAVGYFLLDTGASVTLIQKKLARSIGVEYSRKLERHEIIGVSEEIIFCNKFNTTFWFRGMKITDDGKQSNVLIATSSEVYVPCDEIDFSILGRNILNRFDQTYAFPDRTVDLKTGDKHLGEFTAYDITTNKP